MLGGATYAGTAGVMLDFSGLLPACPLRSSLFDRSLPLATVRLDAIVDYVVISGIGNLSNLSSVCPRLARLFDALSDFSAH